MGAGLRFRFSLTRIVIGLCFTILAANCSAKTVKIGTGSGELNYPTAQSTLDLKPGDTLYINPGVYSSLQLSGLSGTFSAPITVKADPDTFFTTRDSHSNEVADLTYIVFDGLKYRDYNGNAMKIGGVSHDITFKNMSLIRGGTFWIYDKKRLFNGTKETAFYNFKWINCDFDAAGIISEDWSPLSNLLSVDIDFEVSHCSFKNYDCSKGPQTIIDIGKAFNLRVHDCRFSDLGICASPIGHDVCIIYRGYAKVYNNTFTREWGDDVRCFPLKLTMKGYDGPDAVNRFYNNIAFEKRKYAMFEQNMNISQVELDRSGGLFTRTSSEVCFNTMYRSRKVDYCAPLVDIYAPNITVRYNLIVDPECDVPWNAAYQLAPEAAVDLRNNYVYHVGTELGAQPGVIVDHNLVFHTADDAKLVDTRAFVPSGASAAVNAAGVVDYIRDDFFHHPRYRDGVADVGAVQRQ